jgi:hypothetical protein
MKKIYSLGGVLACAFKVDPVGLVLFQDHRTERVSLHGAYVGLEIDEPSSQICQTVSRDVRFGRISCGIRCIPVPRNVHQHDVIFQCFFRGTKCCYVSLQFGNANWRIIAGTFDKDHLAHKCLCFFCPDIDLAVVDANADVHLMAACSEQLCDFLHETSVVHFRVLVVCVILGKANAQKRYLGTVV